MDLKSFFSKNRGEPASVVRRCKLQTYKIANQDGHGENLWLRSSVQAGERQGTRASPSHLHRISHQGVTASGGLFDLPRSLSLTPIEIWIRKIWKGNVVMYGVWTLLCGWWAASDGPPLWLCD